MAKVLLALAVALLIVLGVGYISAQQNAAKATPCETDCINDSGGKAWCSEYCRRNGAYGPAKK
jgi:hypothetical protein